MSLLYLQAIEVQLYKQKGPSLKMGILIGGFY